MDSTFFKFFARLNAWVKKQDFWGLVRQWRFLTLRRILYFPRLFSLAEKRLIILLLCAAGASGAVFFWRTYLGFTHPVPKIAGSYTEGVLGEPRVINPLYNTQDVERDISRLVYAGLISYDEHGKVIMDIAERLDVSEDGRQYDAILKPNVRWHDGATLDADDIVFTVRTIQNPQYKSPLRPNWQGVAAEVVDQRTVRFTLRSAYAPFVENLTIGILPKHVWERIPADQALLHERNLKPIGSGPYAFSSFTKNREGSIVSYDVARNPHYHGEGPYLKRIRMVFFRKNEDMVAAWRRGSIQGFSPAIGVLAHEIQTRKSVRQVLAMPRVFGIFFNLNERNGSIVQDRRVREAIAAAIDRSQITDPLAGYSAEPIESPFSWINGEIFSAEDASHPYDPDAARKLLEQAGWQDRDGDGIREKSAPSKTLKEPGQKDAPLRVTLTTSDWPDLGRAADLIGRQLRDVGIEIVVEKKPFAELESSVIRSRNFEILLFGQVYGYEPDPFAFWHSSQAKDPGLNIATYSNKKADQLLEEARTLNERSKRNEKYRAIQELILTDLPAVFLYAQSYSYILPQDIEGASLLRISLPADRFNRVHQWYRATRRVFR
ncbi:MAG: peptide ABC transporter substrate-binding protein [Candidatus Sungbacteria bacterium]|nr:peptide ABC transporter substrate-binding protein [Candidatus Sungbacteria bacterium]